MRNLVKHYIGENVFDAAVKRIERLFGEFDDVVVSFSGGKDSTVLLNMTLNVAERLNRLPVGVLFIDQESEWETVIKYIRRVMNDPRVKPYWLQVPFRLFNASSASDPWIHCWKEGQKWIRDKEPNSIHENIMGVDRFKELFSAFAKTYFPSSRMCNLAGVRCEESPARFISLTNSATYKEITWGNANAGRNNHFTFYPLYDWGMTDIWKAIFENKWDYCKLYDYYYQYGIAAKDMRVSSVHHEQAIASLRFLQEIEPDTWNKITARILGANTANRLEESYRIPKKLPFMFDSWKEYRDHLLDNLITDERIRKKMYRDFRSDENRYMDDVQDDLMKAHINSILVNDYHGTKMAQFHARKGKHTREAGKRIAEGNWVDQGRSK